ncbi:MAG: FHA domain-containing protein [Verrucomicrobia bacterium]|nr:FHA domain-containing protein [Verrucomicrobiota bacterium]
MIEVRFLSGKQAGRAVIVGEFPFRIGRAAQNDLQLDDPGVWDRHLRVELQREHRRFIVAVEANALAALNGVPIQTSPLRNGDVISFGSATLQFLLSPVQQRQPRLLELFVWSLLVAMTAGQVFWIVRLLRF